MEFGGWHRSLAKHPDLLLAFEPPPPLRPPCPQHLFLLEGPELLPCRVKFVPRVVGCAYVAKCKVTIPATYHVIAHALRERYGGVQESLAKRWAMLQVCSTFRSRGTSPVPPSNHHSHHSQCSHHVHRAHYTTTPAIAS